MKDFAEITLSFWNLGFYFFIFFFIQLHIEDTSRMLPSKRSKISFTSDTPILEISSLNRLSDKTSSVWSHFSPDSTPQSEKYHNQKTNNLMYQLEALLTAWLRTGFPSRWESKKVHWVLCVLFARWGSGKGTSSHSALTLIALRPIS